MAKIHETIIKITPKTAKAVKGIKAVGKAAKRLVPSLNQVKNASLITTAAIAGLTVGIWAMVKSTAAAGDEFDKMSKRLGISAQTLSELKFAAERSGASVDDIEKSIKKLSRTAVDADRGLLTYQRAFNDLDVEIRDINGDLKDSETLFNEVTIALAGVESNTKKTTLAQELLGKSGTKLIPLFQEGAEGIEALREQARLLGITFSDDAAKASADFVDAQTNLTAAITGTKNAIGENLMPPMTEFFNASAIWIANHRSEVIAMSKDWATAIGGMAESVIVGGADVLDFMAKVSGFFRQKDLANFQLQLKGLQDEARTLELLNQQIPDRLQNQITEISLQIVELQGKQIISDSTVSNAESLRAKIEEIKALIIPDEGGEVKPNIFDASPENQTAREDQIKNMLLLEREFFVKERALDNARHVAEKKKLAIMKNLRRADFADFVNNLQAIGTVSRSAFEVWKVGATAQAVITGITGVQEAWRSGMQTPGPHAPFVAAAYATAAALASAARVSAIQSQSYSGGGGSIPSGGGTVSVGGFTQEQPPLVPVTDTTLPVTDTEPRGQTIINIFPQGHLIDLSNLVDEMAPFINEGIEDKVININVT